MERFGDPGFHTHKAMGQYLTLLLYHMVSDPVVPLEPADYIPELTKYFVALNLTVASSNYTIDLSPLQASITAFSTAAAQFESLRAHAISTNNTALIAVQNHKARDFSRGFTSQGGLPTREFYQHTIFAPGRDTGYAPVTFPGVTESVTFDRNATLAQEWVGRTARAIGVAAGILRT
jgi:N-acetylated-alpha-linked acidic dipeptidase